jgi:hypothetical protein
MTRSFKAATRGVLGAVVATLVLPAVAFANDCSVNPYDAYQTAVKRGWQFECTRGPTVVSSQFFPYPPNRIGCAWTTAPVPVPPPPPEGYVKWFMNNSSFTSSGTAPGLKNGWSIKSWELAGGNYDRGGQAPFTNNTSARVKASVPLPKHGTTFIYRLTTLVLTKTGGNCAKAIDEAF